MAPEKRRRGGQDDEKIEIFEVERATSSLQQASRKKARVSYDELCTESSDSSSDGEHEREAASQYATQQRSKQSIVNLPADNGIIEIVTCTNFMCHDFLEIALGPLINFIIGHNGSGKSAVLTAITICLGGKATATNRGQSLKSFIKNGEENSMLSVKIKNTGDSAYQHDVYGDSILVERQFSRSGSSSFKIKSSTGRIISTKKGDLDDICDYFALQIDNPMNVLTQDMARQFLNNSTPNEKYKFFMKGTQLEHLDGDYLIVENNVDAIDQDLWKKTEDVKIFEERAEKARHLLSLSEKQDRLRERIDQLGHMIAWSQVEEQEQELADCHRDVCKAEEKLEVAASKAVSLGEAFNQTEQSTEHAQRGVDEAKHPLAPLLEAKQGVKVEHDRHKVEQLALHSQQRDISGEIKAAKDRIKKIETDIEDEHRRLGDADGGAHTLRRAELQQRREEVGAAKIRLQEHEQEFPALEDNRKRAFQDHRASLEPIRGKKQEVQQNEDRLNSMIKERGQQQDIPANVRNLVNAIRQDGGFRQKPVGPLGSHVQLLKPRWSSVLEKSFGGALDAFIVTSKADQIRLSALMQRLKCPCQILITNNDPIDITGKEPDERFDTALKALEIDDPLVRKQLIINQGIDQTILIEDRKTAIDAMNNQRLHNVRQCFSFNIRPGEGLRLAYGYGGGLSQSHLQAWRGPPRMKTDIEYRITAQREFVQNLKAELNQLEQTSREKQNILVRCEQAIKKHHQDHGHLRVEMQRAESVVDELQDALDNDRIEEGRLDALKDQLSEATEEVKTHESSYGDMVVAKDKNNELVKSTREDLAAMDVTIKEVEVLVIKAENKANKCTNDRMAALRDKNAAIDAVERLRKERDHQEALRAEKRTHVEEFTLQASEVCARVPVDPGETYPTLSRKFEKLNRDLIAANERVGGTRDELVYAARKAIEELNQASEEVQSIEELAQLLKNTLINRKNRWKMFQKHITARARIQFMYLLSERGFRGQLLANHKEKKLDLKVEPDDTLKQNKGRKTMTLSGGEKSFSTICLLLSLWDAMGAPIRCLDEFDVFMDSVNREISMGMMIKAARGSMGKQFILITPQSMGGVDSAVDVKIVKMPDPKRTGKQTRLPFAAATPA